MRNPFWFVLAFLASAPLAAVDASLLAGMKARAIGPAGMSGRVPAIAAVESNPDVVYVGAAAGGVWKSLDGGLTFTPVFDDQPVASIGAIAVDQANPDVVWVGTGEGNPRNSAWEGNGVYRSLDGGKTWSHLGLEKTERIYRIVLHPTDPQVAWVAALGQEWGENADRGVFKTEDGGKSWKKVLYVDERTGASDLVIDPRNPNKLFASMWQYRRWPWFFRSGGPGSGLYVTYDGGRTWKEITDADGLPKGNLGRIGIAIARSNPDVVYATVEAGKSALVRSEDGGKTWTKVNERYDANPRPFYFADLRVDPELPNRVYSLDFNARVSEDGGKTFQNLPLNDQIHGDYHAMWIDPRHPDHFYLGNDGGVAVSQDRGKTAAFVATLPLAQFYHVAVDGQTPYQICGGLQDNGSWCGPNTSWFQGGIRNHQWTMVGDGDGFDTRPDLGDPNYVYSLWQGGNLSRYDRRTGELRSIKPSPPAGVKLRFNWNAGLATDPLDPGTIYLGSQFLHKSTDRGETWTTISPDLTTNNPDWQHQDDSGGLTPDVSNAENYTTIIAIAPSPRQKGVIWVGTDDGRLQLTRDGGKSWTSVEKNVGGNPGVPANTWIPHVLPSRVDAASAFVVFDNHRRADFSTYVYRTDDWGRTWKSLATKDLQGSALAIEQDPGDRDLLFLGTDLGLWVSLDGGGRWMKWTHGVPTVPVMDLVIHPRELDLVIGTHGRAIYVIDDIRPLRTLSDKTLAEPVHLYESGDAQQHWSAPQPSGFGLGSGEFRGGSEPYGALLTFSLNAPDLPLPDEKQERERKLEERVAARGKPPAAGEEKGLPQTPQELAAHEAPTAETKEESAKKEKGPEVEIRIADASGKTLRTFTAPAKRGLNRVAWDLKRDAPKPFPAEKEPEPHPAGAEVSPGTYGVTVAYGGKSAAGSVRVVQDPRSGNSEADWHQRDDAVQRVSAMLDALAVAVERIRQARTDVDAVVAKLQSRKKPEEKDKPDSQVAAAVKLKSGLDKLERRLWVPYDAVGIQPETDVFSTVNYAAVYVTSSWAPPSPTHLEYVRQAEKAVDDVLADFNRFFATDVAAFRQQVDAAGVRLLPDLGKVEVKR